VVNRARFLVALREAGAQALLEERLRSDPEIVVLNTLSSTAPGRPTVYVTEMTPERAERLKQEIPGGLTIESDAPLTPF
jgi:hypothetical protein